MPLIKSGSKKAVGRNISEMVKSGHSKKQAIAAALSTARKYGKKYAEGGKIPIPRPDPRESDFTTAIAQSSPVNFLSRVAPRGIPWESWRRSSNIEDERTPDSIQMEQQALESLDISSFINPEHFAEGGEVEDDRIKSLGGLSDMGVGPEIEQPIEPPRPPVRMEPMLQEYQMGQEPPPEGIDPKYLGMNDAGERVDMRTGQVIPEEPVTRRPNVLPLTRTPEGNLEMAMPKMLDIAGNMMPGAMAPAVPVKAGEMVLSSGMAKTAKTARPTGTTAEEVETLLKQHSSHQPVDMSGWEKTGSQKGSNPGGTYTDPATGDSWYVKTPPTADHANNEKLAAELYKLAGVPVPEVKITSLKGKPAVASRIIKGDPLNTFVTDTGEAPLYSGINGLQENFPVDAWLGNYDAIGTGKDNIILDARGVAHRIDSGGSLRYRAQGKPKTDFGYKVDELLTMKDPSINLDASDVFGSNTIDMERAAAQRIANIDPMKISELVARYGPSYKYGQEELLAKILARKQHIEEYYGVKPAVGGSGAGGAGGAGGKDPFEQVPYTQRDDDAFLKQMEEALDKEWHPPDDPWLLEQEHKYHTANAADVWDNPYGSTVKKAAEAREPEFKPKLPMSLNKTHDAYETVGSLVNSKPEDVTPKQLANIQSMLSKMGPDAVVDALLKHKKSASKLEPWLPPNMEDAVMDKLISAQESQHFQKVQSELKAIKQEGFREVYGGDGERLTKKDVLDNFKEVDWKSYKFPGAEYWKPEELPNTTIQHLLDNDFSLIKLKKGGFEGHAAEIIDPRTKSKEHGFFTSPLTNWAQEYGSVSDYVGRGTKTLEFDWSKGARQRNYSQDIMHNVLLAAHEQKADILIIKDMWDPAEQAVATQFAFLTGAGIRKPDAKFDPTKFHLRQTHLGLVGGGLFGYGALKGGNKEDKMNRGGAPKKKAGGGGVDRWVERSAAKNLHSQGMIRSSVPGRTDKLPMSVPAGSYVLPSDFVSALGQNNSMAGAEIIKNMFSTGPYGMPLGKIRGGRPRGPRMRADGGEVEDTESNDNVPIIAAGGEFVLHPETVKSVGDGDIAVGHKILDKLVLKVRKDHIDTLRKLRPPKK